MCHRHLCCHYQPITAYNSKAALPYNVRHATLLHARRLSECGNVKFSELVEKKIVSMLMDMAELPCLDCVDKVPRFTDTYATLPLEDAGIDSSTLLFYPYVSVQIRTFS